MAGANGRGGAGAQKGLNAALWAVQLLLATGLGMAGLMKTTMPIAQLATNMVWTGDIPIWLVRFIGTAELAAAIGLVLPAATRIRPQLTPLAAAGLFIIQALAVPFHLIRGEFSSLPINLGFIVLLVFVVWGRTVKRPIAVRG